MSIFKSTINPTTAAQIKAREKIVSQIGSDGITAGVGARDQNFLRYTTGKNGWIKMSSFVEYDSQIFQKGNWVTDGRYKGKELAKKYILEGGTLNANNQLRSGVVGKGAIYASELDKISADPKDTRVDRLYGYRPMPGIESANIINISAYGSLREATVQFYAWDRHQLDELEVLFMRPGYTCLLEWGWSQYLDHDLGSNGINSYPSKINIENFTKGIDIFEDKFNDNEDAIYDLIDKKVEKYKGNYDAMLGYVKNFSWQLMPNGGFQCSTTLISRGEALETLKASSNPSIIVGSQGQVEQTNQIAAESVAGDKPILSYFEKIFLNLIGYVNDSEITAKQGQLNTGTNPDGTPANMTADQQTSIRQQTKLIGDDIIAKVKAFTGLRRYNSAGGGSIEDISNYDIVNQGFFIKPIDGGVNGSGIEYISLDSVVAILNTFFVLKLESTKKNLIDIVLPGTTPFLISEDTVSVDPTTCLFYNSKASFITGEDDGFKPELYTSWKADAAGVITYTTATNLVDISNSKGKQTSVGSLGNIYISIQKLIDIYRNAYNSGDGVSILTLLSDLMESVNLALGGINNFKVYTDRNIVQIIDAQYLESKSDPNGNSDNKFTFDLIGLKSICRDVKINSRIFSEQSSMIAIGAASGGTNNIGDIYSSTQTAFNRGLKDRIVGKLRYTTDASKKEAVIINGKEYKTDVGYYYGILSNVISLQNHLKYKVLGVKGINNTNNPFKITRVPQENDIINASSLLKTVNLQINGQDIDFKALIPFELEITLDGLSGFVTGQIFRINKNILPKEYHNKNIGFIITKQSNSLRANDWITTITAQICLLNNEDYPYEGINKTDLKAILKKLIKELTGASYLKYAMADYMVFVTQTAFNNNAISKKDAFPVDYNNVSDKNISDALNGVKDFKAYLNVWLDRFQPGFSTTGYGTNMTTGNVFNPQFRDGLFNTDGTSILKKFPKEPNEFEVSSDINTKIPFDFNLFQRFIYNKELAAENVASLKAAEEKRKQDAEAAKKALGDPNDINSEAYKQKMIKAASYNASESTSFGKIKPLPDSVLNDFSYTDRRLSFLYEGEINTSTVAQNKAGTVQSLPSVFGENRKKILDGFIGTLKDANIGVDKKRYTFQFLNPSQLYLYYLAYITQVYFPKVNPLYANNADGQTMLSQYFKQGGGFGEVPTAAFYYQNFRTNAGEESVIVTSYETQVQYNPNNPAVGGLPSDINLKEDIKLIGKSNNRINIYSFKYKNQEGYYQGVIAQELIGTEFENALIFDGTYYSVDYSKIDVEFKSLQN
jgi:hypothetical protein